LYTLSLKDDRWLKRICGGAVVYSPVGSAIQPTTIDDFEKRGITYVSKSDEGIVVYSGSARQVPLYLDMKGKQVTDKPFFQAHELLENSIIDLLSFGYVTGRATLLDSVMQFRAGEINLIKDHSETTFDILESIPGPDKTFTYDVFSKRLLTILREVFKDADSISGDRMIIVPLSGGYDSRLIACLLRDAGIDNVICVNYGVEGAGEVESNPSREVAARLGYEWYYVEYNFEEMMNEMTSEEFEHYFLSSHGFVSTPHVQEYLLMKRLEKSFPGQELVFVPGHSADFSAGSHITPMVLLSNRSRDFDSLVSATIAKHFTLRMLPVPAEVKQHIHDELEQIIAYVSEPYMAFEIWNWFERQSKFIVNSIRLYEYFEHKWWLPFWDNRFVNFWFSVPLEQKENKHFYDRFVEHEFFEPMGVSFDARSKLKEKKKKSFMMKLASLFASAEYMMRAKDFYMKRRYHNPWGMDLAGEKLLQHFTLKYPQAYSKLKDLTGNRLGKRAYDPNCFLSEILMLLILSQDLRGDQR